MTTMDFWYALAIRPPTELNDEVNELLRDAEHASLPAEEPEDEDE